MYATGKKHSNKIDSIKVLELVSEGKIIGITSTKVFQEILYQYQAVDLLDKGLEVFDSFSSIIDEVLSINLNIMREARNIIKKNNINTRDAVHITTIDYYGISYIASHDKHFKKFKNIRYFET